MASALLNASNSETSDAASLVPAQAGGSQARRQQAAAAPLGGLGEGLRYAAAGGVAGAFAKSCTAPLARLTILYQVAGFSQQQAAGGAAAAGAVPARPPKLRHAFLQVVRTEGPAALWKGNLATILHRLPYSSINFYTYEQTNRLLAARLPPHTDFLRKLSAGALAGLLACSAAYPLDLVRTRLAAQTHGAYYHGIAHTLRTIVADEGAAGLYRGLGATLLQVVPSLALNFSLYDTIRTSCMAVYTRLGHHQQQQQQQAAAAADTQEQQQQRQRQQQQQQQEGAASSSGRPHDSAAHSLAVASSVDQGISHAQMLLWHADDDDDAGGAAAASSSGSSSGSSGLRRASAAAAAVQDAYSTRQASGGAAASAASSSGTAAAVPAGISLASGCVSGFLTATVTFPLDVVRRRMQMASQQQPRGSSGGTAALAPASTSSRSSYRAIIRQVMSQQGGLRGFYVGILPEYCKVVPGVAIAFCTYEQMKKWLRVA